jgi:hypothetical protein
MDECKKYTCIVNGKEELKTESFRHLLDMREAD